MAKRTIKKIGTDIRQGMVIDDLTASVNKTDNAPSIRAVEEYGFLIPVFFGKHESKSNISEADRLKVSVQDFINSKYMTFDSTNGYLIPKVEGFYYISSSCRVTDKAGNINIAYGISVDGSGGDKGGWACKYGFNRLSVHDSGWKLLDTSSKVSLGVYVATNDTGQTGGPQGFNTGTISVFFCGKK